MRPLEEGGDEGPQRMGGQGPSDPAGAEARRAQAGRSGLPCGASEAGSLGRINGPTRRFKNIALAAGERHGTWCSNQMLPPGVISLGEVA